MTHKERYVLIHLFSISDFRGECRPGIKGLLEATQQKPGQLGCPKQMRMTLDELGRRGWIVERKRKRVGNSVICLQIPTRYRKRVKEEKAALKFHVL